VTSIVTRKVQRDHPVGKYVVSLPIGWIRYVEAMSDHDTLNAVEMYEEDGCLAIQPAGLRRFGEGGEFVVSLMEKSEYRLRRKGKRRDFRCPIKDLEGHDKMGYLVRVYLSGKKTYIVPLPEEWVDKTHWRMQKKFYSVKFTIDDILWLEPCFLNLPYKFQGVAPNDQERVAQVTREAIRARIEQPQPVSASSPLPSPDSPAGKRFDLRLKKYQRALRATMSPKQRRKLLEDERLARVVSESTK
jgi:hypothetical protein